MLGFPQVSKKKKASPIDVNPIESITALSSGVSDSFREDLVKAGANDILRQVAGISMDLKEGEEMDLSHHGTEKPKHKEAGIEYHREIKHTSERSKNSNNREVEAKVEQILVELDRLIDSSSELERRFEVLAVAEKPVTPGTYHLNFFDWMLSVISSTRQQIEDSGAWLNAVQSKKSKKSYWSMFKKHGTSFGMSGERMVSTQTG